MSIEIPSCPGTFSFSISKNELEKLRSDIKTIDIRVCTPSLKNMNVGNPIMFFNQNVISDYEVRFVSGLKYFRNYNDLKTEVLDTSLFPTSYKEDDEFIVIYLENAELVSHRRIVVNKKP